MKLACKFEANGETREVKRGAKVILAVKIRTHGETRSVKKVPHLGRTYIYIISMEVPPGNLGP